MFESKPICSELVMLSVEVQVKMRFLLCITLHGMLGMGMLQLVQLTLCFYLEKSCQLEKASGHETQEIKLISYAKSHSCLHFSGHFA